MFPARLAVLGDSVSNHVCCFCSSQVRPRYLKCIGIAIFYLAAKTLEEDEVNMLLE